MSTSTHAILVYGIQLAEDAIEPFDEETGEESGLSWLAWSGEAEDGCEIVTHQSASYPRHIVAIDDTTVTANRGYPKRISELPVDSGWKAKLLAFCAKHNLKIEDEPGWWMCSYWGV